MTDDYQRRYEAHQARKRETLRALLVERHSERMFAERDVTSEDLALVMKAAQAAPSSCNRHGVTVTAVRGRDDLALLGGLLVGGVGWIHRAPVVLLLHGDPVAYRAPGELAYMPFLDAGVMVGAMQLAAEAARLATCFVNPNVREHNRSHFAQRFGGGVYCGALAVGWPRGGDPEWVRDTS